MKKLSFKINRGKKEKKDETLEIDEEPCVEIAPAESDPIMEDWEDAEETNATASPAASVEEERNKMDDDGGSPPEDHEAEVKPADDDSVMTEANANEAVEDTLPTVKGEPSKEEAEEISAEEVAPPSGSRN